MTMEVISSFDDLATAVEKVLFDHLDEVMTDLGYDDQGKIRTWQQLPTSSEISTAKMPGLTVSSPGTISPLSRSRANGTYAGTWLVEVGIFDRGKNFGDTQARIRNWCAGIRSTLMINPSINGYATGIGEFNEQYSTVPDIASSRTFGAGVVSFEATAMVADPARLGTLPQVITTPTSVSQQ